MPDRFQLPVHRQLVAARRSANAARIANARFVGRLRDTWALVSSHKDQQPLDDDGAAPDERRVDLCRGRYDNEKVRLVVKGITIEADAQNNVVNITGASSVTVTANNSATVTAPTVTVNSASLMTINCPLVKINGNLQITGTVTGGFGTADQVGLSTHRHGVAGVPAAAQTVPPTPGT